MSKVTIVIAADEYSFNVEEQLEYAARNNTPVSIGWISFDDEAKQENFQGMTNQQFREAIEGLIDRKVIKHIADATVDELGEYKKIMGLNGVRAWDIRSQIGEQFLGDPEDTRKLPDLLHDTTTAAEKLKVQRIQLSAFHPGTKNRPLGPGSAQYNKYRSTAIVYLQQILGLFSRHNLTGSLSNDTNPFVGDGQSVTQFYKEVGNDSLLLYFNGANAVLEDVRREGSAFMTYQYMLSSLSGLVLRDSRYRSRGEKGHLTDDVELPYVPVGNGDAGYGRILDDFVKRFQGIEERLGALDMPTEIGVIASPHLKFTEYTGELFDEALDAIKTQLDLAGIRHQGLRAA